MTHSSHTNRAPCLMAGLLGGLILALAASGARAQEEAWETPPALEAAPPPASAVPPRVTPPPPAMPPHQPSAPDQAPCSSVVVNCPACPASSPGCCAQAQAKPEETWDPTPVSGYTIPRGAIGLKIEFGYPHMDVGMLVGLGGRIQLGVGYRSVYTVNHTPYADVKFSLNSRNRDVLGLALQLGGGYSFGKGDNDHFANLMAGEYHFFGEAWLRGTARRGRHGLLFGVGARLSQAPPTRNDYYGYGEADDTADKVMATVSMELGYEVRINRVASFFVTTGVDIFTSDDWLPALIRFRMGVIVGS